MVTRMSEERRVVVDGGILAQRSMDASICKRWRERNKMRKGGRKGI